MAFLPSSPLPGIRDNARPVLCVARPITRMTNSNSPAAPDPRAALIAGAFALTAAAATVAVAVQPPAPAHAALFHFRGDRPAGLGPQYGRYLQACPATPNCISSSANVVC